MTIYFTSDTHFGHANVIKYSNRPYKDKDEMDQCLIENWNSRVQPSDTVYHLGDLSFRNAEETDKILNRLNGIIHFRPGNHDKVVHQNKSLQSRFASMFAKQELYLHAGIEKYAATIEHFPALTWNKARHGAWMLHGHCHGSMRYPWPDQKILDVGVDVHNWTPISVDEIAKIMATRAYTSLDHHE
jgi:calcineurin-like phosphoesterase family protein